MLQCIVDLHHETVDGGGIAAMWDPFTIMFCAYVLNMGMPDARLSVERAIEDRENRIIFADVKLREQE